MSIIVVGVVVTKDVDPCAVVVGNLAKFVKKRELTSEAMVEIAG